MIDIQHPDGIHFTLSAIDADKLKNAKDIIIKGGAYNSSELAMEAGQRCQNALRLTFAKVRFGVDFGKLKEGKARNGKKVITESDLEISDQHIMDDVHGLMVYDNDIPTGFIRLHDLSVKIGNQPSRIIQALNLALKQNIEFSGIELIAFELFNASFFEQSARARFLMLMIAIEALLEPKDMDSAALRHVQSLIEATKNCLDLSLIERDSLLGRLNWLLKESISKTGREFVNQRLGQRLYNNMPSDKFFTYCYNLRSKIVHKGTYSHADIGTITPELERFASDILCSFYFDLDSND